MNGDALNKANLLRAKDANSKNMDCIISKQSD